MLPLFVIRAGCFKRDLLRKMVPGSDAGERQYDVGCVLKGEKRALTQKRRE